jgi:hypothetical protein
MIDFRQLVLRGSPYCSDCPMRCECSEQWTALGCSPDSVSPELGRAYLLNPLSDDFKQRFIECDTFDLSIPARQLQLPPLPAYIPTSRLGRPIQDFRGITAIAIPLREVSRLVASMQAQGHTAKMLLGLAEHQQLWISGFERDSFLERAWPRRTQLLDQIQMIGPDAAIAWGYSVWHRNTAGWLVPRLDHFYAPKRTLVVFGQLQQRGIPAVVNVYWGVRHDLHRWAKWLADNPIVTTIAMDLQTLDTRADWEAGIRDIEYFRQILSRDIRCLFSGVCHPERVTRLRNVWPNATLCNSQAWFERMLSKQPERFRETVTQYADMVRTSILEPQNARRQFRAVRVQEQRIPQAKSKETTPSQLLLPLTFPLGTETSEATQAA